MAEILNVGIDLGTSRSAISASNGERFVVDSFVGWPVDMVARKVLKREVLIGHEAVANRTMLDLHRPLERGLLKEGSEKDVEAVRELLKHLLRLVSVNGTIDASNDVGSRVRRKAIQIRHVFGVDLHSRGSRRSGSSPLTDQFFNAGVNVRAIEGRNPGLDESIHIGEGGGGLDRAVPARELPAALEHARDVVPGRQRRPRHRSSRGSGTTVTSE